MKVKPEVQKEIQKLQEKQLKRTMKLLSGSDKKSLTTFLQSGSTPGSKDFRALKPNVQRGVIKLNLTSVDVMLKRGKNPISKMRLKLAKFSYERMLKATT
ncbi:MAG: hypothetical protein PQJ59_08745 [Spirochaetales bacterium]|nr:hypothetical protein [Spirochaetales bacterium]